ncbi:MAG: tetratricopeptide repeat protein [Saprospiraceae bacterium]|nr:tetratricopeptide repeat protein [Saprospiraceae bacterium]
MKTYKENPNWFIDRLTLYQNANSSPEAIKRTFLIRLAEFELIIDDIRSRINSNSLQHELILGRRGSGKSTLLRRIQIEIDEQPDLAERLVAINLAEEQNAIYRLSDLWFEVLEELAIRFKISLNLAAFDTFDDNQAYARYLYGEIHRLLQTQKKRVVLLLDNLDRILENFDDDAHLLRETLLNYQDIQIIGGSTRMSEHYWRYDKPFYDFFRRHRLLGLTFEEIHCLLNSWAAEMELPELHDYALHYRGRVEAIRILTDGLPRALQYFIQVLLHDSELFGFDYLRKVMDKATPLYQERLNNLTPPQRKIVQEMAFHWEATPTKTLVDRCRMESKVISSFLKQLDQFGIVETLPTSKKNHLYRLSERFFNIWLIVTQGNPDQKRRARYLTLFLEAWYDEADLKGLVRKHLASMKDKTVSYDKALVLSKGLAQSKYMTVEERDHLIDYTLALKPEGVNETELPRKFGEINKELTELYGTGKYEQFLKLMDEIENEEDGLKFYGKGLCLAHLNRFKEAEEYYVLAFEKGHIDATINLANIYFDLGNYVGAEKLYLLAIEKGKVMAFFNLANLYLKTGRHFEAEKYYLIAIENGEVNALNNLAWLYFTQEKYTEAEKLYLQGIEKGDVEAMFNIARMYSNQNNYIEAEKYYLQASEKGDGEAMFNLALLYSKQRQYAEAERYYLQAIEKGQINALNNLANIYVINEKYAEAEKYYLEAIKVEQVNALNNLAILYAKNRNYTGAKKYYLLAIQKEQADALNNLADLYRSQNKNPRLALEYINKYSSLVENVWSSCNQLLIEIWNGIFDQVTERIEQIIENTYENDIHWFWENLLYHQQTQLVLSFFESEKHGPALRDCYVLIYYTTRLLAGQTDDNLQLRIPPEVLPTVEEMIQKIRDKQTFYAKEPLNERE